MKRDADVGFLQWDVSCERRRREEAPDRIVCNGDDEGWATRRVGGMTRSKQESVDTRSAGFRLAGCLGSL
jgi:hypothetical protein